MKKLNNRGQGMTEYLSLLALVVVVGMISYKAVGQAFAEKIIHEGRKVLRLLD